MPRIRFVGATARQAPMGISKLSCSLSAASERATKTTHGSMKQSGRKLNVDEKTSSILGIK
jgi:hypothetical protein